MAAKVGRKIVFKWNGVEIEGVREKGLNFTSEPIDITTDDSNGVRELLAEGAQDQVDLSLSGVSKSKVLLKAWTDGRANPDARMGAVEIIYPEGDIVAGTFRLNNYTENGVYNDAVPFEAELQSSGAFTYTAAP